MRLQLLDMYPESARLNVALAKHYGELGCINLRLRFLADGRLAKSGNDVSRVCEYCPFNEHKQNVGERTDCMPVAVFPN